MSLAELARESIMDPLEVAWADWQADSNGFNFGGFGLRIRTRDLVKVCEAGPEPGERGTEWRSCRRPGSRKPPDPTSTRTLTPLSGDSGTCGSQPPDAATPASTPAVRWSDSGSGSRTSEGVRKADSQALSLLPKTA